MNYDKAPVCFGAIKIEWNNLDEAAMREAEAMITARKTMRKRPQNGRSHRMSDEQATWDEMLEVSFTQCKFCGRTLKDEEGNETPQDTDVCRACGYLDEVTTSRYYSKPTGG